MCQISATTPPAPTAKYGGEDLLAMLLLAKNVARRAGNLIMAMHNAPKAGWQDGVHVHTKSSSVDLVTTADHASQALIFRELREQLPHHRLIGEEDGYATDGESLDNRPTWIVDAIDGTTNFVHRLSDYCVSVAFANHGVLQAAAVFRPAVQELFYAARGYGAFLNDERLRASPCSSVRDALVISEWSYERTPSGIARALKCNERLLHSQVRGVRQLGSGALDLCYVAAGRADAVYGGVADGDQWHVWDYAAGALIAREAGAELRRPDGSPFQIGQGRILCATPGLVDELTAVLDISF